MAILLIFCGRFPFLIGLTFAYRVTFSLFLDYLLSCIDPLLKISQLNYEESPVSKLSGNSHKIMFDSYLVKRRFSVNLSL